MVELPFHLALKDALVACVKVIFAPHYHSYLRATMEQNNPRLAECAFDTGHGGMLGILTVFLGQAVDKGLVLPIDCELEAECLLAQAQGSDVLAALVAGREPSDRQIKARIDKAVSDFCRRHSALPQSSRLRFGGAEMPVQPP